MTASFQVAIIVFGLLMIVMFLFTRFWQHEYENALKDRNKWRDKYYRAEEEGMDEHEALMRMRHKYVDLQKEYREVLGEMRNKYLVLKKDYEELLCQVDKNQQKTSTVANADMLYAVKYAMKHAHPDCGGKQEDFIRFHKVYNELRGRAN